MPRLTTEDFIVKSRTIHGEKYNYDKTYYIDAHTKVTIICPEHGEFQQLPSNHTHKTNPTGCPSCGRKSHQQKKRLSLEQFLEKAKILHGNKYDYSKTNYVKGSTPVTIICPIHGEFQQKPVHHIYKQHPAGCPECGDLSARKKKQSSQEEFLLKCKSKHGNKYDYSRVIYTGYRNLIEIICPEHGLFQQVAGYHSSGSECHKCAAISTTQKQTKSTEQFIEEARKTHGDKYDYSKVDYKNIQTPITIICPVHGEFQQFPNNHLDRLNRKGAGCKKCASERHRQYLTKSTQQFIEEARQVHGDKYDYSKSIYTGNYSNIIITCLVHGDFPQLPSNHLVGNGCPNCFSSKGEDKVAQFLTSLNIDFERQKSFEGLSYRQPLRCDFYLPDINLIIEFNGRQHYGIIKWHKEESRNIEKFKDNQARDEIKRQYCRDNGIELLEIRYDEDIETALLTKLDTLMDAA